MLQKLDLSFFIVEDWPPNVTVIRNLNFFQKVNDFFRRLHRVFYFCKSRIRHVSFLVLIWHLGVISYNVHGSFYRSFRLKESNLSQKKIFPLFWIFLVLRFKYFLTVNLSWKFFHAYFLKKNLTVRIYLNTLKS